MIIDGLSVFGSEMSKGYYKLPGRALPSFVDRDTALNAGVRISFLTGSSNIFH